MDLAYDFLAAYDHIPLTNFFEIKRTSFLDLGPIQVNEYVGSLRVQTDNSRS